MKPNDSYGIWAGTAAEGLMALYNKYNPFFNGSNDTGTAGWDSAVALEAMIDYMTLTGKDDDAWIIDRTYEQGKGSYPDHDFTNAYYDDNGWWAITWMKAADYYEKKDKKLHDKYLQAAVTIFKKQIGGWDDLCGGGLYWQQGSPPHYKAAIQNELFLVTCARLYRHSQEELYRTWAEKVWYWFQGTGMIGSNNLVQNGLSPQTGDYTKSCSVQTPGDMATWTYNQGVILGGLTDLYQISTSKDHGLMFKAMDIANAAIDNLHYADSSILKEPCEDVTNDQRDTSGNLSDPSHGSTACGGDGKCFKGIFMRYLAYFYHNLSDNIGKTQDEKNLINNNKTKYLNFMLRNAESVWANAKDPNSDWFSTRWVGPFDAAEVTDGTQMSALDTFNAVLLAQKPATTPMPEAVGSA